MPRLRSPTHWPVPEACSCSLLVVGWGWGPTLGTSWAKPQQEQVCGRGEFHPPTPRQTVSPLTPALAGCCLGEPEKPVSYRDLQQNRSHREGEPLGYPHDRAMVQWGLLLCLGLKNSLPASITSVFRGGLLTSCQH